MRLCPRRGGSESTTKGCSMHQRSCKSQSLRTYMTTFLPGLERQNCRTRWKMHGGSVQVSRKQFALDEARTHCVMCDSSSQKLKKSGRFPAQKRRPSKKRLLGFRVFECEESQADKFDRSVGLQIRFSNVASSSPSAPMKLAFTDPLKALAD